MSVALGGRRTAHNDRDLARGPARLCAALGLDRSDDGALLGGPGSRISLTLPEPQRAPESELIRRGPRTGVAGPGGDGDAFPWRFWLDGEPTVSTYRPAVTRRRSQD